MEKEWSNPYNSFNSYKGLLYRKQFDGIISGKFLPPIEVNIDPCNNCNIYCIWCNGKNIINRKEKVLMSTKHLLDIIEFCADWGVKAICFAGGGEPTLHPDLALAFERCNDLNMESAIITNGLFLNDNQIETITKYAKWIGVSVDADCSETYKRCKGADRFSEVIANIKKLTKSNPNHPYHLKPREITFKYLIHPLNQYGIYNACKLAEDLGVNCFHSRLISTRYIGDCVTTVDPMINQFNYNEINRQLDLCKELNTDKFKVFTIEHKQEGKDNRRIRFNKCRVSPLLCMFEADGTTSICIDRKGEKETMLCNHDNAENIRKTWGSDYHKNLLSNIHPEKDCPKCTLNIYHELLDAYQKDLFCKNFP